MRIAVVGSGIAGLLSARRLSALGHEVVVFEARPRIGGHVNTLDLEIDGQQLAVDTGFIVFNRANYPVFSALLDELEVTSQPTDMGFSMRCDRSGIEWSGADLNRLFIQRRNLLRPSHLRMLADVIRFHRLGPALLAGGNDRESVAEWLRRHRMSDAFRDRYLLPLGAALWSCEAEAFADFSMRFVVEFLANHQMMTLGARPEWEVVQGGSMRYVDALLRRSEFELRPACPVHRVLRLGTGVELATEAGTECFDEVVMACHADTALAILDAPTALEEEILGAFSTTANEVVVHTDTSVLPRNPRAWAAWNYLRPDDRRGAVAVTYDMTRLQSLPTDTRILVTLNPAWKIPESHTHARLSYHHPFFQAGRVAAQRRHHELIRHGSISYCGAWWGAGFHEDGAASAERVAASFGLASAAGRQVA